MELAQCLLLLSAQLAQTSTASFTESATIAAPVLAMESAPSAAEQILEEIQDIEVHAFVSQGFIKTSTNNYLARSERGSFEFSEVGINFTKNLTRDLRGGIQFFARKLGPIGNFDAKLDWFYLDYRFADWFGIRAGRVKLPFGLYNETSDIDAARVPILLPQSVYPIANRDYLLAQTGGEIYGYVSLDVAGALEYRLYGGTIFLEVESASGLVQVVDLDTPYLVGGRLMWETPLEGLRLGGSLQALRLDTYVSIGGIPAIFEIPVVLWAASIEYTRDALLLAAEYSSWHAELVGNALIPSAETTDQRGYFLVSYEINEHFHPGAYYSVIFPNIENRKGRAGSQQDFALTLRFDINSFWLVKVEGHYLRGTAALSTALNDNKPLTALERDWLLFMLKTTLYF
jgi:hypothetical protein